jgi:triosephosphate isomerase
MAKYRKKIVAGNWKMNLSIAEATELASSVTRDLAEVREVDVVLCPPFTVLSAVGEEISGGSIKLGAQNMHWEKDGAYTGEISAAMLRGLFCRYVILGHSERRTYFGETDEIVNRKAKMALESSLEPIICVGEQLEQREADQTNAVLQEQLRGSLDGLGDQADKIIVAYEPVWAIGTGLTATPEQAQEAHAWIRSAVEDIAGSEVADGLRIQYGGSVKPDNARELMSQPDVDGALVGGASLESRSFVEIVRAGVPGE